MEYECTAGSDFSGCIAPIVQVYYNFCVETVTSPHDNLPKQTSKQKNPNLPVSKITCTCAGLANFLQHLSNVGTTTRTRQTV